MLNVAINVHRWNFICRALIEPTSKNSLWQRGCQQVQCLQADPQLLKFVLCLHQCFRNLAMRTWKSKASQWEKRDLLSRMRPKCGPNLELLRTSSRYFHQNAMRSLKITFCDKSAVLFIMEGMLYNPISQEMHAFTLVLNLIEASLSLFHSFPPTFLS